MIAPAQLPGSPRIWAAPEQLVIEWPDGNRQELASLWLRDNCAEDRDPQSGQRLIDVADLPLEPRIRRATLDADRILIEWQDESRQSAYPLAWLARYRSAHPMRPQRRLWLEGERLDPHADFAWVAWDELDASAAARSAWLTRLLQDGIAFVRRVPGRESAVLDLGARLGRVAETNYGQAFDVRAVPQPENLAYSDLGLGLHTDNPYREPVPGFQVLHVLIASPDGGASRFADGFALAEHLRAAHPGAFAELSSTPVPFAYRSSNAELHAERPLIQLSCTGEVVSVHYNNRSIAPLALPAARVPAFYSAYRLLAGLLRERRFQLEYALAAGDAVVFDNLRVLHGRTAFSSARHPRHLRGCYLTRDSVASEAALLARRLDAGG
jgi:gamma-butyrobetaine dioxygenase